MINPDHLPDVVLIGHLRNDAVGRRLNRLPIRVAMSIPL